MQFVTVVNRTSKPLEACWDGVRYAIPVGESQHQPIVAEIAKRQNPLMGSEDPYTLQIVSLLGIKEHNDDCTPIEQSMAIERTSDGLHRRPVEVVQGKTGMYSHEIHAALPVAGGFVDPSS